MVVKDQPGLHDKTLLQKKDPHTAGLWPLFPYHHHPTVPSSTAFIPHYMVLSVSLAASLLGEDTMVTPVELGPLA